MNSSKSEIPAAKGTSPGIYIKISPNLVFPEQNPGFRIFIKRKGRYVLYTSEGDAFTQERRNKLSELGLGDVYILADEQDSYRLYLERNLGLFLNDENIPLEVRAKAFHEASENIVRESFEKRKLDSILDPVQVKRIVTMVNRSVQFLISDGAYKSLSGMISHDYNTFSHSLNVYILSVVVMQGFVRDQDDLVDFGMGAILHDVGKMGVSKEALENPASIDPEIRASFESHPIIGVGMCASLNLSGQVINTILFHHERLDGNGYPSRISGEQLTLPVRVLSLCDVYETLTSDAPHRDRLTPFEALQLIKTKWNGAYDETVFKRLILVLSGAAVI